MIQQWKPGRLDKKLFISRPHQPLDIHRQELLEAVLTHFQHPGGVYRQTFKETLLNGDLHFVKNHQRKLYKTLFYNEGLKLKTPAPRRYYAQPQILGWDIFWAIEDAMEQDKLNTYEQYTAWIGETFPLEMLHRGVAEMALSLISEEELRERVSSRTLQAWVLTMAVFYANSFMVTPYEGARREIWVKEAVKEVLTTQHPGLKIVKTSEVHDVEFMIDYVIVRSHDHHPVLGISVKGPSWANGYASTYRQDGETREQRGHAHFNRTHGAPVSILVSHQTESKKQEHIITPLLTALQRLGF